MNTKKNPKTSMNNHVNFIKKVFILDKTWKKTLSYCYKTVSSNLLVWFFALYLIGCNPLLIASENDAGLVTNTKPLLFSELPPELGSQIFWKTSTPPIHLRKNPYSTPMYYLFAKGFTDGLDEQLKLDKNRLDWQDDLFRDFSELGLTATHLLVCPEMLDDPYQKQALIDYIDLSAKYGMKIGVRLGGSSKLAGLEGNAWQLHPNNPDNRIDDYVRFSELASEFFKGKVIYYIIGDELSGGVWEKRTADGKTERGFAKEHEKWTYDIYMQVFSKISQAIRKADPSVDVSMFATNGLITDYLDGLFQNNYKDHAQGRAANIMQSRTDAAKLKEYVNWVKERAPEFAFYSSGVGYVAASSTDQYPSNHMEKPLYDDYGQAIQVAKMMYWMFDAGWDITPYYITVRRWVLHDGTIAPHWYGFFGFTDLLVDKYGHLTTKRYPAWYAFQTIANVFHSKDKTQQATFEIKTSVPVDYIKAHIIDDYQCILILWNEKPQNETVSITIGSQLYTYPVRIPLFNYREFNDLSYKLSDENTLRIDNIKLQNEIMIIRLVKEEQLYSSASLVTDCVK